MAGFDASASTDAVAFRGPWVCSCRPACWADFEEGLEIGESFVGKDEHPGQANGLLEYLVAIRAAVTAVFRELILLSTRTSLLESTAEREFQVVEEPSSSISSLEGVVCNSPDGNGSGG
jgi:hypothetical protein